MTKNIALALSAFFSLNLATAQAAGGPRPAHEGAQWGHADASAAAALTNTCVTAHFVFRFAENEADLRDVFSALEAGYRRVSRALAPLPARLRVEIYPDINLYHRRTFGANSEDWMTGNFDPDENVLRITSPNNPGAYHKYNDVLRTAVHELTHAVTFSLRGGTREGLPAWLDEGTSIYYSGQLEERARKRVHEAVAENRVPDIEQLEADFLRYNGYSFAGTIVEFVVERYGEKRLREFLRRPADYERIFQLSPRAFNDAWHEYLAGKYQALR